MGGEYKVNYKGGAGMVKLQGKLEWSKYNCDRVNLVTVNF